MIPFELAAIFTRLQERATRLQATRELAAFARADQVLLFVRDRELGVFLPAAGMPQTLRQGERWQEFLQACDVAGNCAGVVPSPVSNADVAALGLIGKLRQCVIVFTGGQPSDGEQGAILALLPLLGANLELERQVAAAGHAAAARHASALNDALDSSRREAEGLLLAADRRKDDFLAMLAHELRNPLAPIGMAARILKQSHGADEQLGQLSAIIERQVGHMSGLLDDLLDVARVTSGVVVLDSRAVDLKAVLADAVEQVRPMVEGRRHRLTVSADEGKAWVLGDATRLVQIVANLLNNATKYTPEGGHIALHLALEQGEAILAVRDNGIGIEPALLPHVFELFTQALRSFDRAQGGLGLGLALVRNLAERHGGWVTAQSGGLGQGSAFVVRLPLLPPGASAMMPAPAVLPANADGAPLRIMIVDDNADAADTLGTYLDMQGHTVCIAYDADSALAMALRERPAVLLLDIGLPGIDGYELARRIRAMPESAGAMLIALTGYSQPADRSRALAAGFDHHLSKPVDGAELARLLAMASARQAALQHLEPL